MATLDSFRVPSMSFLFAGSPGHYALACQLLRMLDQPVWIFACRKPNFEVGV